MKILFLANLIPYPLDGGGKIFTFSTIQALSKNHNIDLVCFFEHENIEDGKRQLLKYCDSVDVLPIRVTTRENMPLMMLKAAGSMFSSLPLGISKYISYDMKALIRDKMQHKKYDCILMNILAMFGYRDYIKQLEPDVKVVLYEQNCEALIYKRYFEQTLNPLKKLFLRIETSKLEKFEQKSVEKADRLILLSDEDRKQLDISPDGCSIIPIGVTPCKTRKAYDTKCSEKIRMLFVGTMTWAPNNEGIIWFLKNVMPTCADIERYELTIVGKNPSEEVHILSSKYDNVNLMGYVESLDSLYSECDVLIVPLFIGSGQRVKIIEAFSRRFAVISTSIGAEGLQYQDGESILIADDAEMFKEQIEKCFDHNLLRRIGANAGAIFDEEYSVEVISQKLNSVIE